MSNKDKRVAAIAGQFHGGKLDRHYTGYFELFNQRKFYEAHEVLEHIWLKDKHGPNGAFYKGLIQLAGAFVHLQKNRPQPAASLLKTALANLEKYPHIHEQLDVTVTRELIADWQRRLEAADLAINPFSENNSPKLSLTDQRGWVFYDGDCAFCTSFARRFDKALQQSGFMPVPFQTPWVCEMMGLKIDRVPDEMIVLTADGRKFGGADGIMRIARHVWWAWPLFLPAQLPGMSCLFRAIYRRIAANRHCLGAACKTIEKEES